MVNNYPAPGSAFALSTRGCSGVVEYIQRLAVSSALSTSGWSAVVQHSPCPQAKLHTVAALMQLQCDYNIL